MSSNLSIYAAAAVAFTMGTPAYTWQSGQFSGTIVDTATGNITIQFAADKGIDATECVALLSMRGTLAASGLTAFSLFHSDDLSKNIRIVQEAGGGGASVAADVDFDVVFLKKANA